MAATKASAQTQNRLQLLIILLTPILVVASSSLLYFSGWLAPKQTSNHGFLVTPVMSITDMGLPEKPITQDRYWQLIQYSPRCEKTCLERMTEQRQIHMALGKYQPRLKRVLVTQSPKVSATTEQFSDLEVHIIDNNVSLLPRIPSAHLRDHPVFVVDPFGNVMLYFTSQHDYKAQISDLKKLLKNSTIG